MEKKAVCELLEAYVHKGHAGLKAEKEGTLAQETADTAEVAADKAKMDMYNTPTPPFSRWLVL